MVESDKTGIFYIDPTMVDMIPIGQIKPYKRNAKRHPQEQIEQIINSIKAFGMNDPIGVWGKDNIIVEGHGRYLALREMGESGEVPVIHLDNLTDEQRKAYALAHNKLTMNTDFDFDLLQLEMEDLSAYFDMADFGFLEEAEEEKPKEIVEDEIPLPPQEPKAKVGEIYQLGRHRLMCGDSTDTDDVLALMDGAKADLFLTDPPYNVDYTGKTKDALKIVNDVQEDSAFQDFLADAFANANLAMKPGAAFYIWHADLEGFNFRAAVQRTGWKLRQCLVWVKNTIVLGRQDYQWKHEPCLYGWKEGAGHTWSSDRKQSTVLDFNKPLRSDVHPTMKPLSLFAYQIENNTNEGDIVLDIFGGSGTTVLACEQDNRKACVMEQDPHYVDVIIDRWETFTGEKAVRIS